MKIPRLLLVFLLAGACVRADNLGDGADVAAPKGWAKANPLEPGMAPMLFPTLKFVPADGRNEAVLLSLIPAAAVHVSDLVSLKAFLMQASAPMLPSPGFVPAIRNIEIAGGIAAYASFEDPSLVGKPPEKGNYKVATPVVVLLPNGYVVQTTVFTDTLAGADFDEAMGVVKGVTPLKAKERSATQDVVVVQGLDAVLRLPPGRFSQGHAEPNSGSNYFTFVDNRDIILSGWLDRPSNFPGIVPFWVREKAALEKGGFVIKSEMTMKIGGWDAILYVVPAGPNIQQKNLRACRVVGGTWADIHLSRTAQGSTFKELQDVVRSLDLVAAPGGGNLAGQ